MKKKCFFKQRLLITVIIAILIFSIFKIGQTFASTSVFSVTNVAIINKTETTDVNDLSYEDTKINSDITFHKIGDSITYKITIKNNKNDNYIIKSVTSNSSNDYITYEFDDYSNTSIGAKQERTFYITAKYINDVTDMAVRNQDFSVDFSFKLEDDNGEVTEENIEIESSESKEEKNTEIAATYINPKTGDKIHLYVFTSIVSSAMLIIIFRKNKMLISSNKKGNKRKKTKFLSLFLVIAIVAPTISKAESDSITAFSFDSVIRLKDKLLVTYNVDGETNDITVNYEEMYTVTGTPIKEGYNFDGWYTAPEGGEKIEGEIKVTDDIVLYAHFTATPYSINYELNHGTASNPTSYTIEDKITLEKPTRTGYTFIGWTGSNGDEPQVEVVINEGSTGIKNYVANYTPNDDTEYTVIYSLMNTDGTTYTEKEREVKTGVTDSEAQPLPKSYSGFDDPTPQKIIISADGKAELTYKYTRQKYSLQIEDEEYVETETPSGDYFYNRSITLKAKDKEGYTFTKWSNGSTDKEITFNLVTNPTTIKPEYEPITYTISFNSEGGTDVDDIEVEYNTAIGTLPSPTKEPLVFAGWYTDENYTEKINKNTVVTGDKTYYAKWVDKMVTVFSLPGEVTFNGKDGFISCETTDKYDNQKYIDTGVVLFDEDNYKRDFEIEFEIVSYDGANQDAGEDQHTLVNAKYEYSSWNYPGFTFRKKKSSTELVEMACRATRSGDGAMIAFNPSDVKKFIISRKNNVLYIRTVDNNSEYTIQDLSVLNDRFSTPVTFGASLKANGTPYRYIRATVKDLKIKVAYTAEDYVD